MSAAAAMRPTFPQFSSLPAELRLKIWEDSQPANGIHILDVCYPSSSDQRSTRAFTAPDGRIRDQARYDKYKDTVFLDALDTSAEEQSRATSVAKYAFDPSTYRHAERVRAACIDGRASSSPPAFKEEANTIYLPGPDKHIAYDNSTDLLLLRFREPGVLPSLAQDGLHHLAEQEAGDGSSSNGISKVLQATWSPEMAQTIRSARRIALDLSELWPSSSTFALTQSVLDEMAFLACCLQQDLEVLYLVNNCPGRCPHCGLQGTTSKHLQRRGQLALELDGDSAGAGAGAGRKGDVFSGVGKTWREVFDLERMGWADAHGAYGTAQMLGELVREQQMEAAAAAAATAGAGQGARCVFGGVRILVCDDEVVDGLDTRMVVDCQAGGGAGADGVDASSSSYSSPKL